MHAENLNHRIEVMLFTYEADGLEPEMKCDCFALKLTRNLNKVKECVSSKEAGKTNGSNLFAVVAVNIEYRWMSFASTFSNAALLR